MKLINKLGLGFAAAVVVFGGIALLQSSLDSAEAKIQPTQVAKQEAVSKPITAQLARDDDADEVQITPQADTITEAEAIAIANAVYKGDGKRTDVELEMENSVLVYAVEFTEKNGNEVDVKINAKTGVVVLIESDETDDENDD